MRCHNSRVPTTPTSASQCQSPARQNRRHARGTRRPERRSSTASATIEATTHKTPSAITPSFRTVGLVMNRVSTSMRADKPGCAATSRSVKTPAICGFFSADSVPAAPGMPTKSAPTPPTFAQMCNVLQAPEATAGRGATAATESRNATTIASALARTTRPLRLASMPPGGMVEKTSPPAAGRVAIAWHGIETSRASGAPDTSGAVTSVIRPSGPGACGHEWSQWSASPAAAASAHTAAPRQCPQ